MPSLKLLTLSPLVLAMVACGQSNTGPASTPDSSTGLVADLPPAEGEIRPRPLSAMVAGDTLFDEANAGRWRVKRGTVTAEEGALVASFEARGQMAAVMKEFPISAGDTLNIAYRIDPDTPFQVRTMIMAQCNTETPEFGREKRQVEAEVMTVQLSYTFENDQPCASVLIQSLADTPVSFTLPEIAIAREQPIG
ncbi:MAG: hypothetical protein AAGF20_05905 [Pseudomonadota bacterium]